MPSKQSKFQILDEKGNVIQSGKIKSNLKSPYGTPLDPDLEKPLLAVTVTNPFKKFLYWLDLIRRKQTTTLAFKISIPLIALPVLVFAVYKIGKGAGISLQKELASPPPSISAGAQSITLSRAGILKVAKSTSQTRYLLSLRNGTLINLQIPNSIDLSKYANKQVLVTGSYNKTMDILTVTDIAEVEVFNTTLIPQETSQSAK